MPRILVKLAGQRCDMKRVYAKEAFARNAAGKIFEGSGGETSLYPYKCRVCRRWHLSHHVPVSNSEREAAKKFRQEFGLRYGTVIALIRQHGVARVEVMLRERIGTEP